MDQATRYVPPRSCLADVGTASPDVNITAALGGRKSIYRRLGGESCLQLPPVVAPRGMRFLIQSIFR